MAKENSKTKEKKSKKKSKDADVVVTPAVVESKPVAEEVKVSSNKTSLLPASLTKPINDLKRRVEVLEALVAKVLSTLDK